MYNHFDVRGNTVRVGNNTVLSKSAVDMIRFEINYSHINQFIELKASYDENGERIRYPSLSEATKSTESVELYRVEEEYGNLHFRLVDKDGSSVRGSEEINSSSNWDLHYDLKNLVEEGKSQYYYNITYNVHFSTLGVIEVTIKGDKAFKKDIDARIEKTIEEIYEDIDTFYGVTKKSAGCYIKE